MKKIISLIMAVALVLSVAFVFASCTKEEEKEKLICGVTVFKPMNYKNDAGNWTGFDTEFAELVGKKLGMDVEFKQIEWGQKYNELKAGTINCIWNGFTANGSEEDGTKRVDLVDFSYSYMLNQQCVVVKAANKDAYATPAALAGKTIAAEKGSAGEEAAEENRGNGKLVSTTAQIDALVEVKAGAVDCAVMDILLAKSLVGKGDYSDLAIADAEFSSEVYAVGFKQGSELTAKVNKAMKELNDEGKLEELAKKYELENSLLLDTEFKS